MIKILAIIPTYNEAENVGELLFRLDEVRNRLRSRFDIDTKISISNRLRNRFDIDILVVDDNSPDKTAELVNSLQIQRVSTLIRAEKSGLGPAYLAGFNLGLKSEYKYFIQMDADLSHKPEQLELLLSQASTQALVIGTRWMQGGAVINWPSHRRFISKLGTKYASIVLNLDCKDLTSGYRVLPIELLKTLDLAEIKTNGYGFQIEMAWRAHIAGFEIKQVPITFTERENGRSKMGPKIVWEAWLNVSIWGFKRLVSRR